MNSLTLEQLILLLPELLLLLMGIFVCCCRAGRIKWLGCWRPVV